MVYRMVFNVDGGCRRNGSLSAIGAAACCLEHPHGRPAHCRTCTLQEEPRLTNQQAGITAIIMALDCALEKYSTLLSSPELRVTIYSDSQYAVNCMKYWVYKWCSNGWINASRCEVVNRDLIQRASNLDDLVADLGSVDYI